MRSCGRLAGEEEKATSRASGSFGFGHVIMCFDAKWKEIEFVE